MSNTVITNYTDLNGPSTKADSSVVVIVNKDGSLSVDQNLLGTLMGTDGSQATGISVVRVGHEGKPDDATDSENEDEKVPHVTLSVDSYYDEPNSIIKYDSGAEMLQSLRIETRENSLVGFQNDHCYTSLTSPSQSLPQRLDNYTTYDEPVYEITHTPPPKPIPISKKITIIEEQIIPKGKKIIISPTESSIVLKGNDVLNKPLAILPKPKHVSDGDKSVDGSPKGEETLESSISSGESIPDRDSDSDYKDSTDRSSSFKGKRIKLKPRILKSQPQKVSKLDTKVTSRIKINKSVIKKEIKEKIHNKSISEKKQHDLDLSNRETKEILIPATEIALGGNVTSSDQNKSTLKAAAKPVKKEKKTPAHVTALLSDMTSLFSTPDVIRRVSTDNKNKNDKDSISNKKPNDAAKQSESSNDSKMLNVSKVHEDIEKIPKHIITQKTYGKPRDKTLPMDKTSKGYDLIPQLDDASLAQILQDTTSVPSSATKVSVTTANALNSPGMAGPLSPSLQQLDLLGGLQPEEEGLTEDILMHVAQLVESSENLQEVIDKQVLGKVDAVSAKTSVQSSFQQQHSQSSTNLYSQTPVKTVKTLAPRKDPIEIVRRDGRVITLPPIEAPATRASKRKTQMESTNVDILLTPTSSLMDVAVSTPEPHVQHVSKQYVNKKLTNKKQEQVVQTPILDKVTGESQESWNSEDDPNRLWCICKQPHNNRFMICCDGCEDWFHGKCVNVTKAMGQQMEEQGIEWRCPNCTKKAKTTPNKSLGKKQESETAVSTTLTTPVSAKAVASRTNCIVCKKSARSSSIYCSDACILKHAQDSLGNNSGSTKSDSDTGKSQEKQKSESRVIVYERKTGRLLAGPNAPTAENLKTWLQKNPTFEVVRPGTLSTIKPKAIAKKSVNEPNKIQTTLNFERIPRKLSSQSTPVKTQSEPSTSKMVAHTKEEVKTPQPKTPIILKFHQLSETPKASTSAIKSMSEPKKLARTSRSLSTYEKPSISPSTSRRKEPPENRSKMSTSVEPIRENVRKALQEQMSIRMAENTPDIPKFTEDEIQQFAFDTEIELHELFNRDVGMKYKAKYRSLMFNIKDRKNLSLWQKICDHIITPKQLVRLSPEELASQELAQWRAKEEKHQLELIKKSELDLLAASKTYVLKTHKGEEVMETKEPVKAELDASVPVEDLVTALNEDQGIENVLIGGNQEGGDSVNKSNDKKHNSKKKEDSSHKKSSRESKRDSDNRKSRSSRRSDIKDREERSSRRSGKKASRGKSSSRDRSKIESSKDKSDSSERSRYRSRSIVKSRKKSKSREPSRSSSQDRERSRSRGRSKRRSREGDRSRDSSRRRHRSRSKHRHSADEKVKQRSKSQDNEYSKNKNDSTDSDSVERPKSAMMKEVHPEYDPHEPMITSAFSEEDLRKSREDVYEDSYKSEIEDYSDITYDPSKTFSLDTNILPTSKLIGKRDKISEGESDQEPSSTMETSAAIVWNGCINMVDVARFYVAAHEVSGNATDLEEDISAELDIVGRINPDTVWDYISKMRRASNKDIIILKLQAANDEEKMQYIALYSYLSSRNRLGVVKVLNTTTVKDFYIVPLPANTALPPVLLPLDGPGLGEIKTHLLLAIVIRQRKKRLAPHIPKDIIPAKVVRESRKRSYTPPLANKSSYTPPSSPRRRAPLPLPAYTSPALSTSVKDKIAATLASADDEEAYSPGSSSSSGSVSNIVQPGTLRSKMEELNRQIEEQKQQIRKMTQADSSISGEDEAYSPSRPMTPPSVAPVPLSDIALPSNLQEILATIKQRSETASSDVDMRTLPLPQ